MRLSAFLSPKPALTACLLPLCVALNGCGGEAARPLGNPASSYPSPVLCHTPLPPVRVQALPGVEGVIGMNAAGLLRQFGPPRLDLREGDARKLQFAGVPCVLDIYLYPLRPGAEPQASHVEARRGGDGRAVDRAACIALLRHR